MPHQNKIIASIEKYKAVAILRFDETESITPVMEALYNGGIRIFEFTMTMPDALDLVQRFAKNQRMGQIIGVGSVMDAETVERAVDAGAEFIVSPVCKKEIIDAAKNLDTPVMPGAFTPTEIQAAWEWGADIVKVFPADILGMDFFRAVKAPMPYLKMMPTGGVSLDNGSKWIKSGASAVGVGSALIDKKAIRNGKFNIIAENARKLVNNLNGK